MTKDEIIERILTVRRDLSRKRVDELIAERKRDYSGFLSDEGAARLVAHELLGKFKVEGRVLEDTPIGKLVPGLNDVTISGRVLIVWPLKRFTRKDGSTGSMIKLLIADKTGKAICVIWDPEEKEDIVWEDVDGVGVRVMHGYTREGLRGGVEVHVGGRGSIQVNPPNLKVEDLPTLEDSIDKIGKLRSGEWVNIEGTVKSKPQSMTFNREGVDLKVSRLTIADSTGEAIIVAWNKAADRLQDVNLGDRVEVRYGYVKEGIDGEVEVHLGADSILAVEREKRELEGMKVDTVRLSDVKPWMKTVNVLGKVLNKGEVRSIEVEGRGKVEVAGMLIGDESGLMTISLWDEKAKLIEELDLENVVLVEGATVSQRGGRTILNVGKYSKIKVNLEDLDVKISEPVKVKDLDKVEGLVMVEGKIVGEPILKTVETVNGKVDVSSFDVNDGTAEAPVSLWREHSKEGVKLHPGDVVRFIGMSVRRRFDGAMELTSNSLSKLEVISEGGRLEEGKRIYRLKIGDTAHIEGLIIDIVGEKVVKGFCPYCGEAVTLNKDAICIRCDREVDPILKVDFAVKVDDGTGVLRVEVKDVDVDVLGVNRGAAMSSLAEERGEIAISTDTLSRLIGRKVRVYGRVVDEDGKPTLNAREFKLLE